MVGSRPDRRLLALSACPYWTGGSVLLAGYVFWARHRTHPALRFTLIENGEAGLALALSSLAGVVLSPQGAVMGVGMGLTQGLVNRGLLRQTTIGGMAVLTVTTATMLLIGN